MPFRHFCNVSRFAGRHRAFVYHIGQRRALADVRTAAAVTVHRSVKCLSSQRSEGSRVEVKHERDLSLAQDDDCPVNGYAAACQTLPN